MTAQIVELNVETKSQVDWTEAYKGEEELLEYMFIEDLAGETEMVECWHCGHRDEIASFIDPDSYRENDYICPCCGVEEDYERLHKAPITAEDFIEKWSIGWGFVFGNDLNKPMGFIGALTWAKFDTTTNTLTYRTDNRADRYFEEESWVTVDLPSPQKSIINLSDFGAQVFKLAQNQAVSF